MLQIYTVGVSVFLGGNKPSGTANVRGDIRINFSCDPEISSKLVDLTLDEMKMGSRRITTGWRGFCTATSQRSTLVMLGLVLSEGCSLLSRKFPCLIKDTRGEKEFSNLNRRLLF
ncbi:uncharacterized protein LOC126785928 [Argentina anserina]|uniref:uncharacterized protein LOC126785928 n=1 Tax=Argentina anserina TaxID=57926 RepID=UPI0021763AE0|nr:uncharacterized protein LOC126785928 [Potentilla anserina]